MMQKVALCLLIAGILLILASFVLTAADVGGANVIGGADWPTFVYYCSAADGVWFCLAGTILSIAAVVMFVIRKR